jgi:hypothetical protein
MLNLTPSSFFGLVLPQQWIIGAGPWERRCEQRHTKKMSTLHRVGIKADKSVLMIWRTHKHPPNHLALYAGYHV